MRKTADDSATAISPPVTAPNAFGVDHGGMEPQSGDGDYKLALATGLVGVLVLLLLVFCAWYFAVRVPAEKATQTEITRLEEQRKTAELQAKAAKSAEEKARLEPEAERLRAETEKKRKAGLLAENQEYRLPTDEEWSRAVGTTRYPWGNDWPPPRGVGNYSPSLKADDFENTSPVGSFKANRYGLFDMEGNVRECCMDWYRKEMNPEELRKGLPGSNDDKGGQTFRVLRGGCYVMKLMEATEFSGITRPGAGQKSWCSRDGMLRANNGRRPRPCGRRGGSRHRDVTCYQKRETAKPTI